MSDFDFIPDPALRSNIDQANELIRELVILNDSKADQGRKSLISSLRKTIIIQTATIIEALLL